MMNAIQPRPELQKLPSVTHGAFDFGELARLGLVPEEVLDFSVNSNPFGPSPQVRVALETVALERYPDRESLALRRTLATHLGVAAESVLVGSGVAELLWLLTLAFVRPSDKALILGPTFGEYAHVVRLMGGQVVTITLSSKNNFLPDREQIEQRLMHTKPRLFFVCNPNNPTGQTIPLNWITAWVEQFPQTLFVVDEAYVAFAPDVQTAVSHQKPNLLILRSMTKDYAIAGLRLGYAVGDAAIIVALAQVQPPWSVNAMAQAAGLATLADHKYLQQTVTELQCSKEAFVKELVNMGFMPVPSATHFFLLPVADAPQFRLTLLRQGLLVRDCSSFGLPNYVRIATRRHEENGRLLAALREMI